MKPYYPTHCRGSIAIVTALSLIVLIGIVGLAIDLGRGYGVKAKLNAAVDAAAIAAARALVVGATDAERIANAQAAAQRFFAGNFPPDYLGATPTEPITTPVHDSTGRWTVTVSASANMPTTFLRVIGKDNVPVAAMGRTIRRDLDMILVLDTTGSLGPPWSPAGTFAIVKAAAVSFINKFAEGPGNDRVGLVTFAYGAVVDEPINKDATRGFNKASVTAKINALTNEGGTTSAEAMRRGYNELDAVPVALRSSLRVIVFFSDGAPNGVPATFTHSGGDKFAEDIYAGPLGGVDTPNPSYWSAPADAAYKFDQRNNSSGTPVIPSLPQTSGDTPTTPTSGAPLILTGIGGITLWDQTLAGQRSLGTQPYINTRCNVNRAARNMLEYIANKSRDQNIVVFSIGLGSMLNQLEVVNCGYDPSEYGANIMKRVANTTDSDTRNDAQPTGRFIYAADASELDSAFSAIASEMLRLAM